MKTRIEKLKARKDAKEKRMQELNLKRANMTDEQRKQLRQKHIEQFNNRNNNKMPENNMMGGQRITNPQDRLNRFRVGDRQRMPSIVDTQPGINRERQPVDFSKLRSELMRNQMPQQIQQIPPQNRGSEIQDNLMEKMANMPIQPSQPQIQNNQQMPLNQSRAVGPQQQEQQMKQQLIPQKTPDQETEEEKLKRLGISPV